jgi:hypothetical protein
MLLQDLLAYLFVFALAILIVVQVVRSIRNARRVRLGFNAGICADGTTSTTTPVKTTSTGASAESTRYRPAASSIVR